MLVSKLCVAASVLGFAQAITTPNSFFRGENCSIPIDYGTTLGSSCACSRLSQLYPSSVLTPNTTAYTAEATHYWSSRQDLSPKCIFTPSDDKAVARGLVVLELCRSQFAVRGAGHMPVTGAANSEGGVLVALTKLNSVVYNEADQTAVAGAAQTWYGLAAALEPFGRIVIGGRLKTIGISGLTLGGGIHYFINKFGFPMDNIISYDVALLNGTVVTASNTSHSDLFWGLKGAGQSNYGIVTKFVFKTYDMPLISSQQQIFPETAIPGYLKAVADLAELEDGIAAGAVFDISKDPNTNQTTALMLGVQEGASMTPSEFANFTVLPSIRTVNNISTYAQWASKLDTPYQTSRYVFGAHTCTTDAANMLEMYNMYAVAVEELVGIANVKPTFVVQNVNRGAAAVAENNGIGNTWGLDASKAYIFWEISTGWTDANDDQFVLAWQEKTMEKIHEANIAKGLAYDFIYGNDAADYQDPYSTYPAENLVRMKHLQDVYDPNRVFKNLVTGGYKIPQ